MFIGHYALAFAAKRAVPNTSLTMLFIATQFIDLLWPVLLLLGVEHVRITPGVTAVNALDFYDYPYTHSLLGVGVWSFALGGIYYIRCRNVWSAVVVGGLVASHWFLDLLTHRPDLLLIPGGSQVVGLGLWNSLPGTLIVEGGLFLVGCLLYYRGTRARGRIGSWGFFSLILVLSLIYVGNIFGPPPESVEVLAASALGLWIFVWWAGKVDRHRVLV